VNLIGFDGTVASGTAVLEARALRTDLHADAGLPDDTRLWAALQDVSGGAWGGTVYDVDAILRVIEAGKRALARGDGPQ
jgi:hypothetical protein